MKRLNLMVAISTIILLASGMAIADDEVDKSLSNQQFSGQRPYMKAPTKEINNSADEKWQGATLVTEENPDEAVTNKGHANHQQLRLNFLGKRPFMENYPD